MSKTQKPQKYCPQGNKKIYLKILSSQKKSILICQKKEKPYFCRTHLQLVLIFKLKTMAYVISDDCIACGTCMSECPSDAISEGDIYKIDADKCVDCGTCADACPTGAIHPGE